MKKEDYEENYISISQNTDLGWRKASRLVTLLFLIQLILLLISSIYINKA